MTGQAGKVARGLRTIGANITQLAQNAKTFDITVNGATKTIQLWNETGTDMLNTYDVLKQISAEWENMTNAEKSSLAVDLAKKTQMDTFLAVLGNFEDAEKAYTTALLSEGSAWEENAAYMESIEAHQAKLKAAWETLVLSQPFEDLEKSLLDAGTALLNFANSDIGNTIIKVTAFVTIVGLLVSNLAKIPSAISAWIVTQYGLNASITAGAIATDLFTKAILSNPIFWGVVAVAGVVAVTKALDALIVTYDEQIEKLNESTEAYENAQNEVKNLESQLKSLKEAQDSIADKKVQVTDPEQLSQLQQQSNELERQRAILERQLAIAKAKADEAERQAKADAQATLGKKTSAKVSTTGYGTFEYKGTPQEVFQQEINSMRRLQAQIIENNKTLDELKENEVENSKEIDTLTKRNNTLTEHFNNLQAEATKTAEELGNVADTLGDVNVEVNGHKELLSSLLNTFADFVGWDREATNANSVLTTSFDEENDELEKTEENIEDVSDAYSEFFNSLEDIQNSYETLSKAAEEYNTNGFITASTLKKLNKIAPEYLVALKNEGEQYSVNVQLLKDLYEAEQTDAIEKLELAKNSALCKLANEYLTEATDDVTTAITNSGNEAQTAAPKYEELAKSASDAAIKMREVHEYLVGGEGDDSSRWERFKKEWDETSNWFDQQIENVKKSNIGLADSSSKAAKSSKDAWIEAFEEEQRQLKHSLEMNEITELEYYQRLTDLNEKYFGEISGKHQKYIKEYQENEEEIYKGTKAVYDKVKDYLKEAVKNGYEKAINALEKEEKKVLAEIKKQIDALKKEKSSVLDDIKDEIDALKRQKDAVQDYYNKQIDVIKKENDVLQEQNELLEYQQALQQAKAQKVMVMQDGKFQLGENESAVAQAEQNLSNYQDQLSYEQQIQQLEELRDAQVESIDERIASLEEYYDYMEDYYDKQIESMELYYDQVQEQYELQIEALQSELDAFKEGYQKSEDLENAKLAASVLAANEEAAVWQTRLENLANAVTEYNKLLSMIGEEGTVASSGFKFSEASYNPSSSVGGIDSNIQTRASGDASFKNDEIALVGESPNTELVLGSRLNKSVNSGVLTHLSKGSGVVNAESTQTLAGLLNGLANPTNVSNARSTQQTFNFGAITLPNVTNAESFVGALRDKFNNYSIQYSTIKK